MTGPAVGARRFRVTGRVQGVFFRASTARVAAAHGLRGHARNLPDGSVEVLAIGSPAALAVVEEFLQAGPPHARVDAVDVRPEDPVAHAGVAGFTTG